MPSFPIYSEHSAVAASCEKSNSLLSAHPRAFPWKMQPTSHCFQQQTEEKETFTLIKLPNRIARMPVLVSSLAGIHSAKAWLLAKAPLWELLIRKIL